MPSEYESSLVRAGRVLRERWWIVVLAALACVVSALAVSLTSTKQYEASATLLFRDPRLSEALFGAQVFEPSADPARDSSTNVELVRSNQVADAVRRRLGLRRSIEDVSSQVTVEAQSNADLVDVTVRDPDPTVAASMADAFAAEYVSFRQRADRAKIAQGERLLRERIATLPDRASDERGQLQAALEKLIALEAVQTGNAEPIDRAVVPTAAVSPKPLRDAGLALAVGLSLGVGVSLILEALDRRVKSVEEFERLYGQRAVAIVPQDGLSGRTQKQAWVSLEPYQMIRSRIDYRSRSSAIRTVLVTSAVAAEGKTTVAVNLARAAAAGRVVVVVEADLRRPTFDRHFALEGEKRGLSNALMGVEPVRDLLQHGDSGGLLILPSGPIPPDAADLLEGKAMREVLDELVEMADLVIIDAPALLPTADGQVLLGHHRIDACIVVARAYHQTRQEARRTRSLFEQHGVEPLGLVVTGVRTRDDYGDYDAQPIASGAGNGTKPAAGLRSRRARAQAAKRSRPPSGR